jgi:hypothetical protein
MPTGILGQSNPAANTNTTVYTVPATKTTTFNVSIVNMGSVNSIIKLAVSTTGTPTASEYIEFQTILPPAGVLERGGIVAQEFKNIVVNSSTANVSVSVYGFEA